jgi:hypothetical protein
LIKHQSISITTTAISVSRNPKKVQLEFLSGKFSKIKIFLHLKHLFAEAPRSYQKETLSSILEQITNK